MVFYDILVVFSFLLNVVSFSLGGLKHVKTRFPVFFFLGGGYILKIYIVFLFNVIVFWVLFRDVMVFFVLFVLLPFFFWWGLKLRVTFGRCIPLAARLRLLKGIIDGITFDRLIEMFGKLERHMFFTAVVDAYMFTIVYCSNYSLIHK